MPLFDICLMAADVISLLTLDGLRQTGMHRMY